MKRRSSLGGLGRLAGFLFVLTFVIGVHEAGHALSARAFDVWVVRYQVGWGKPLIAVQAGETSLALSPWLIGGKTYLAETPRKFPLSDSEMRYLLMNPPEMEELHRQNPQLARYLQNYDRWFDRQEWFLRLVIIVAGPLASLFVGALLALAASMLQEKDEDDAVDRFVETLLVFVPRRSKLQLGGPLTLVREGMMSCTKPAAMLEFTALISALWAMLNLLPVPTLDGWEALQVLLEVGGIEVSPGLEQELMSGGAWLLLAATAILLGRDIFSRPARV